MGRNGLISILAIECLLLGGCGGPDRIHDLDKRDYGEIWLSPDEETAVFAISTGRGRGQLWVADIEENRCRCISDTSEFPAYPVFLPDSNSVVYSAIRGRSIQLKRADVASGDITILDDKNDLMWPAVSADGQSVIAVSLSDDTKQLMSLNLDTLETERLYGSDEYLYRPQFSKDGTAIYLWTSGGFYNSSPIASAAYHNWNLERVSLEGKPREIVVKEDYYRMSSRGGFPSDVILYDSDWSEHADIYYYDVQAAKAIPIAIPPNLARTDTIAGSVPLTDRPKFRDRDKSIYFLLSEGRPGVQQLLPFEICVYDLVSGEVDQLTDFDVRLRDFDISSGRKFAVALVREKPQPVPYFVDFEDGSLRLLCQEFGD